MAIFNALWINGGKFNSVDLDFFASKQIFNLYLQVAAIDSNGIHYYDWGPSPVETAANIDWVHSYDRRMKVLDWTGCRPELYGYCDISTAAQRAKIIASEAAHVQACHFDGLASDLETSNGNPPYNNSQNLIDFFNAEAAAMHNLGKISAPFVYAGQGLWMGNFDNWKAYFPQLNVDYAVITMDNNGTEHTNPANNQIGYIETLKAWLDLCPSKLAPTAGYGGLLNDIAWTNDYVALYGLSPKQAGWSLYDYSAGQPGTPPSNQIGAVDSPITAADWVLWDAWALKNLAPLTVDFKFSKAYHEGIVNLTVS